MSDATHTPAPWRVVTDGISHWIEIEPNKIALIHAKKADRDLIVAAPDLLAALTKLVANWDANHIPSPLDDLSPPNLSIEEARAAINNAKGIYQ